VLEWRITAANSAFAARLEEKMGDRFFTGVNFSPLTSIERRLILEPPSLRPNVVGPLPNQLAGRSLPVGPFSKRDFDARFIARTCGLQAAESR
jgi:hypothetical protein